MMNKLKPLDWTEFDQIQAGFEGRAAHTKKKNGDKSNYMFFEFWGQYLHNIRHAHDEGKLIVGHAFGVPTEILYAMDMVPMHMQTCIGMAAVSGSHMEDLTAAKTIGFTQDACSVNRLTAGYFLNGKWPKPDLFVGAYSACDGIAKNTDLMRSLYPDMPYFHFEQPYRESAGGIAYMVEQLKDLIAFLEEQSGKKMDWDKLSEHLGHALRMAELHKKISELRKVTPVPLRSRKVPELELADFYFCGSEIGTKFYETVYAEAKERVARGEGGIAKERFRLASPYVYPTYVWGLVDWLEKEWGAVHVTELFFSNWGPQELDPSKPLECIAKKMYAHPIVGTQGGSLEWLVPQFTQNVKDYKADALMWWAHRGCPHGCGSIYATSKVMKDELKLPVLEIDSDYVDPHFEPVERMREKLNTFFEMLESQKG